MKRILGYIRFDWPVFFLLLFTNWLPDNVIFLRFRGWLITPFLGSCQGRLKVARNVVIQNPSKVSLGKDVYIGHGSCLLATEEIKIGNSVLIAPYCVLVSSDHARNKGSFSSSILQAKKIIIEDNCWLGAHVVVTAGSKLTSGICVGAGAVVHGTFDQSTLIGGIPAKIIKHFD